MQPLSTYVHTRTLAHISRTLAHPHTHTRSHWRTHHHNYTGAPGLGVRARERARASWVNCCVAGNFPGHMICVSSAKSKSAHTSRSICVEIQVLCCAARKMQMPPRPAQPPKIQPGPAGHVRSQNAYLDIVCVCVCARVLCIIDGGQAAWLTSRLLTKSGVLCVHMWVCVYILYVNTGCMKNCNFLFDPMCD